MANKQIKWNDSDDTINVQYTGKGNDVISISSSPNEMFDRTQNITIETSDLSKSNQITINQPGLREPYECSDGELYECKTDSLYGLLKS